MNTNTNPTTDNQSADEPIHLQLTIHAPVAIVWQCLSEPFHIRQWNFAHDSWHCPQADHDWQVGGTFCYRMQAKDDSVGFDYAGVFDEIIPEQRLAYHLGDNRTVSIRLQAIDEHSTLFDQSFEPERTHDLQMQRSGWLAIAEHLKAYSEQLFKTAQAC